MNERAILEDAFYFYCVGDRKLSPAVWRIRLTNLAIVYKPNYLCRLDFVVVPELRPPPRCKNKVWVSYIERNRESEKGKEISSKCHTFVFPSTIIFLHSHTPVKSKYAFQFIPFIFLLSSETPCQQSLDILVPIRALPPANRPLELLRQLGAAISLVHDLPSDPLAEPITLRLIAAQSQAHLVALGPARRPAEQHPGIPLAASCRPHARSLAAERLFALPLALAAECKRDGARQGRHGALCRATPWGDRAVVVVQPVRAAV